MESRLPKAIIFVLDNDILKYAGSKDFGMSVIYGRLVHYLFSEVNKLLTMRKEMSPLKGLCDGYPQVLWIHPPFHMYFVDNTERAKFGKALDKTVTLYQYMWSLKLTLTTQLCSYEMNRGSLLLVS